MPISYDRIISLLNETEQATDQYHTLRTTVMQSCNQHLQQPLAQQLLTTINLLFHPLHTPVLIAEKQHLERFGKRNENEKLRARRRREEQLQREGRNARDRITEQDLQAQMQTQEDVRETLIDDQELTDEQLLAQMRQKGLMPAPVAPMEPHGLPGADRLKAANNRFRQETLTIIAETEADGQD